MDEKLREYKERRTRWQDKTNSQLGFLNNLILTIGIAFLTFNCKSFNLQNYRLSFENIDFSVSFLFVSVILVFFSIILGLGLALNRLWDFRITTHINRVRQNVYQYSKDKNNNDKNNEGEKLDESTPDNYNLCDVLSMYRILSKEKYPNITIEDCKDYLKNEDVKLKIKREFKELRGISHNLGRYSSKLVKFQIIFLGWSIFFFLLYIVF